jgi:hypothetical protein
VPRLELVVVQSLEVALEIPSQEDIQAQSQEAVVVMEILNLVVVVVVAVVAEADHVLPALQRHLLMPLQHCNSHLQQRRHLVTLEEILMTPFPLR